MHETVKWVPFTAETKHSRGLALVGSDKVGFGSGQLELLLSHALLQVKSVREDWTRSDKSPGNIFSSREGEIELMS